MQIIDNINHIVKNDLQESIRTGSKLSIAAACFSIYAYQELKKQLESIDELRFIFTSPTFVTEKTPKAQREFYIPRISRECSLYGTEFEVKLRNELTQKAVAKECADWIRRKAIFITYNVLDEHYDTDIFTEPTIKGKLGTNAMKAQRHLYDHIVYDSTNERDFATDLDTNTDVAVYVKLPDSFYIATPVGHYNPDWAIAFYEGTVKHIYFVAETKGSMSSMQLRLIEESKIHCAREHFKAISNGNVVYDVVDSYRTLLERVMK